MQIDLRENIEAVKHKNKFLYYFSEEMSEIKQTLSERNTRIFYMNVVKAGLDDYLEILKWVKSNNYELEHNTNKDDQDNEDEINAE